MSGAAMTAVGASHAGTRLPTARRSLSSDSLDSIASTGSVVRSRDSAVTRAYAKCKAPPLAITEKDSVVSRLELLLAPRRSKVVFTPGDDTALSQKVNKGIKMSAEWGEVQAALMDTPALSASNVAFGLYRLGCLDTFASQKRQIALKQSGFVPALWSVAMSKLKTMDAGSLVLVLDGCARLEHNPSSLDIDRIAECIMTRASALCATQLGLVMWAFHKIGYVPRKDILAALEHRIPDLAGDMSPQSICLTLQGFQATGYQLDKRTLHLLAHFMQCKLPLFKPSDLATSLDCLATYNYQPSPAFVEAVKSCTGRNINASRVSGKGALGDATITAYKHNSGYVSS